MDKNQLSLFWDGLSIQSYDEVNSTNTTVKEYLKKSSQQEILVIAKKQKNGRGRHGRKFYSKLDHGLYFSLAVEVRHHASDDLLLYTIAAATAMVEAIQSELDLEIDVKWVNDLFYQGRKVGGILLETVLDPHTNTIKQLIIGIGLNLAGSFKKADEVTQRTAGSLYDNLPADFNPNYLLAAFLQRFKNYHDHLTDRQFIAIYKKHLMGMGQTIYYRKNKEKHYGRIKGIDDQGRLIIENKEGKKLVLLADEIHFSSQQFVQSQDKE